MEGSAAKASSGSHKHTPRANALRKHCELLVNVDRPFRMPLEEPRSPAQKAARLGTQCGRTRFHWRGYEEIGAEPNLHFVLGSKISLHFFKCVGSYFIFSESLLSGLPSLLLTWGSFSFSVDFTCNPSHIPSRTRSVVSELEP